MRVAYILSALSAFAGTALGQSPVTPAPEQATAATGTGEHIAYSINGVGELEAGDPAIQACTHMCTVIVESEVRVTVSGMT